MKHTRLNLAALRGTMPSRLSADEPTLTEVLSTPESVNLSRRELLGLAGVAAVSMPPLLRKVGPALLGRFQLVERPGRVAFKLGDRERWVIDCRRFGGQPRLKVEKGDELIRIALSGARYPGTELPADLTCELRRGLTGWRMKLRLALGGLTSEGPLENWLAGAEPARGRARLSRTTWHLGDGVNLSLGGITEAEFLPDWRLTFRGMDIASLSGMGDRIVSDTLTVALLAPDTPSIISQPPPKRTLLVIERGQHDWAMVESLPTPAGGKFVAPSCAFDTIHIEAGQDQQGQAQRAIVARAEGKATKLWYVPSPDWPGADGEPFALPLREARYAVALNSDGHHEALLANFDDDPVWLHGEGLSVQLAGGADCPAFEVVSYGGRVRQVRCEPALLTVLAPLPGAIIERAVAAEGYRVHFAADQVQAPVPRVRIPPPTTRETEPQPPPTVQPAPGARLQVPPAGRITPVPGLRLPQIRLPGLTLDVIRPHDMLVLKFEFRNLSLNTTGAAPQLVRDDSEQPAYIIVHFPPQHIAEQAFFEVDKKLPVADAYRPPEVDPDPDEDTDPDELRPPPVQARLSGPSRLVFEVPEEVQKIDYTLQALLNWTNYKLSVAPTALPPPPQPDRFKQFRQRDLLELRPLQPEAKALPPARITLPAATTTGGQGTIKEQQPSIILRPEWVTPGLMSLALPVIREPQATETAIEAPYRLIISPSELAGWVHTDGLVKHHGRVELWHTRLGVQAAGGGVFDRQYKYGWEEGKFRVVQVDSQDTFSEFRSLRAIWSPDYSKDIPPHSNQPFRMSLDKRDRCELVWLTSDFFIPDARSRTVHADRLMLTPLGVWMNTQYAEELPVGKGLSVEAWRHQAVMGRDQYVQVVYKGYLFPFGHRASLIKVTERKFHTAGTSRIAYLRQRMFIVVREPEKTYAAFGQPNDGRRMPLRRVRITTLVTPNLDKPEDDKVPGTGPSPQSAFWVRVANQDFRFQITAEDWDRQECDFSIPLIFIGVENVPGHEFGLAFDKSVMSDVVDYYNDPARADESRRRAPMFGQKVALADSSAQKPGDTSLEVEAIIFGAETTAPGVSISALQFEVQNQPCGYPILARAEVRIPAVAQVTGNGGSASIEIDSAYADNGWHTSKNKGQIFAKLVDAVPLQFGADQSGGLATPDMDITGLSRKYGPVGGSPSDFAGGSFDPQSFFADSAKMLGAVLLKDIVKEIFGDDQIPKLTSHVERDAKGLPEAMVTQLKWNPEVKSFPDVGKPIFVADSSTALTITAILRTELSGKESMSKVEGKLSNFALNLIPMGSIDYFIRVAFRKISFLAQTGKKLDVSAEVKDIKFGGPLTFINTLSELIPMDGFSDPPYLDISPSGIKLGYTLPIPSVGVGVFSLQNMTLSAGLTLPFFGGPLRLRFAFCSREDPFLITVSMFGGGGFFAMELTPKGLALVEASFEFGGNFSMNIGVASGGVYVMAGVYFKWEEGEVTLMGYLRMGGSLEILGIITLSMEFYMCLTYQTEGNRVWGQAKLTVEIEILFFSISVTLTVERQFAGSPGGQSRLDGIRLAALPDQPATRILSASSPKLVSPLQSPTFEDLIDEADWIAYCNAFA